MAGGNGLLLFVIIKESFTFCSLLMTNHTDHIFIQLQILPENGNWCPE